MENQHGQTFQDTVYQIVCVVPRGSVTTYGQIGAMIPCPGGIAPPEYRRIRAQWVGRAMRHAPEGVPWHRVINGKGRISLPAVSRSAMIQRLRLESEGIEFDRSGTVDLNTFGWKGPPKDWLNAHQLLVPPAATHPEQIQLDLFDR